MLLLILTSLACIGLRLLDEFWPYVFGPFFGAFVSASLYYLMTYSVLSSIISKQVANEVICRLLYIAAFVGLFFFAWSFARGPVDQDLLNHCYAFAGYWLGMFAVWYFTQHRPRGNRKRIRELSERFKLLFAKRQPSFAKI